MNTVCYDRYLEAFCLLAHILVETMSEEKLVCQLHLTVDCSQDISFHADPKAACFIEDSTEYYHLYCVRVFPKLIWLWNPFTLRNFSWNRQMPL